NLLSNAEMFRAVPDDWHIIITDIKNSTAAVQGGRHEQVNLIATGSIVSVLNIAFEQEVSVPFFFGGDGATFMLPPLIFDRVMKALALYRDNTRNNFNLELRIGTVTVSDVYQQGHELHISKYSSSAIFSIPILLGYGLSFAEQLIKGKDYLLSGHAPQEEELNLSGMQCRWDQIPPPEDQEEVVTLLILAREHSRQAAVFREVMDHIDTIYGSPQQRQPISINKLKLKTSFDRLGQEISTRLGRMRWFEVLKTWVTTTLGRLYFRTPKGQSYLKRLVEMSDTLVIDGKINTVISGTVKQSNVLRVVLDALEAENKIVYGMHISGASVMSCYVRDMEDGHIHFVDGSEGGYTKAATVLKAKLAVE
ncbi:MAG: DUF3095 domain-containing protein, partial [Sphingobacteriales bacterium]